MEWAAHDHRPKAAAPEARLELLELCWQVVGPSRKILSCGVYRTEVGLELRCGYDELDLFRSERVPDVAVGRLAAAGWKALVLEQGGFTELGPDHLA